MPIGNSSGFITPGSSTTVVTGNVPNSCSSNSATGKTVCVSNGTDVYILNGTTLTSTLTDFATGSTSFTGGSCTICGVVVDSASNTAELAIALTTSPSGSAYQALNLATNTFSAP